MIIAFVVIALLGGAGWYYLSGQLAAEQGDAQGAASDFDTYTKKEVYLPTASNVKTVQNNIDLMTAQLDPLVKNELQSPQNELGAVQQIDTVEWKHRLDDEVRTLNNDAKIHGITVPEHFYYGFSRYLSTNPTQEATPVLSRQLIGVKEIAETLIKAPVQAIVRVQRTYEEDPVPTGAAALISSGSSDSDQLPGRSQEAAGGVYTAYPFEVEFDAKTEAFRQVIQGLMQSHYVFVIRSIMVQNSRLDSPKIGDLDSMAGTNNSATPSLIGGGPGAVAASASTSTVGVQYLFGNETLHVRMNIDLIDWHGIATEPAPPKGK
jgi:hypothetical protein